MSHKNQVHDPSQLNARHPKSGVEVVCLCRDDRHGEQRPDEYPESHPPDRTEIFRLRARLALPANFMQN